VSPEVQSRLAILRQKAVEGTLTLEEQKEAIIMIRGDRQRAVSSPSGSAAKRSMAKAVIPSADEMLNELGKI
jgi:hypothetical protein